LRLRLERTQFAYTRNLNTTKNRQNTAKKMMPSHHGVNGIGNKKINNYNHQGNTDSGLLPDFAGFTFKSPFRHAEAFKRTPELFWDGFDL
jgi:hypothetical protein